MSMLHPITPEPRLFTTSGTWGPAELVGSSRGVLLSLQGRNYDVAGRRHITDALAYLSPSEARRLSHLLHEASAVAENAPHHQPGLWSDATVADVAARMSGRAAQ